jgi:hypothetical protein
MIVTLALGAATCSGSSLQPPAADAGNPDGTVGAPATASAFCAQYRDQGAAFAARCSGGQATDYAAVQDAFITCDTFDTFVTQGTLRYHAELAAACLATDSPDRDCFAPPSLCFTKTLEGLLAPDAPCVNDYQCPANAACWAPGEFGFDMCVQSTCFAVADMVGEACTPLPNLNTSLCFPGVVTCVQNVCAPFGVSGDPCGDPSLAGCGAGLRCDATTLKCTPISSGGACSQDTDCIGTEFCTGTACAPRVAVGGSCAASPTACAAFEACDASTMLCVAAGHIGQPCGDSGSTLGTCATGVCLMSPDGRQVCQAPLTIGSACSAGTDCASKGCANGMCASCPH